jgi:NDP-sugar pyrophosphorylase family protein
MQAVILAGGLGSRLRPLTLNQPKPVVPIGNKPFLLRQIESLKRVGIKEIILSLNYQPGVIQEILGNGRKFGVRLRYVVEPVPLGTAGAFKYTEQFIKTDTIVLNGDILTDICCQTVIENHRRKDALATIVLTPVEDPTAYGLVSLDEDQRILEFLEKPKAGEIKKLDINTINAGIYVFDPKVLELIPPDCNYSFEHQLFPSLLENKERFYGHVAEDNYWIDIGTHERYLQAHYDILAGKVKNFQIGPYNLHKIGHGVKIDQNSFLANGCNIGSNSQIINSFLGENVVVEENTIIRNSVIWSGTKVGSNSVISGSIIGSNCSFSNWEIIGNGSVIKDNTKFSNDLMI